MREEDVGAREPSASRSRLVAGGLSLALGRAEATLLVFPVVDPEQR